MTNSEASEDPEGDIASEQDDSVVLGASEKEKDRESTKNDDENAESSSTGSSAGKSGSRGGYSADCSASDQSSDDTGALKSGLNLAVSRMKIGESASDVTIAPSSSPSEDENTEDNADAKPAAFESKKKPPPKGHGSGTIEHTLSVAAKAAVTSTEADEKKRRHHRPKRKTPIAAQLEAIAQQHAKRDLEAVALEPTKPLPQWNGVRISHPMDPRIDLSTVMTTMQAGAVPAVQPTMQQGLTIQTDTTKSEKQDAQTALEEEEALDQPTIESYVNLMEAVRPFFHAHGFALPSEQPQTTAKKSSSSEAFMSSEGFTSFFTTTDSNKSGGGSPETSDMDKKHRAGASTSQKQSQDVASVEEDKTDASSMKVLARAKRKHRHQRRAEESSGSNNSSTTSGGKRVRIVEFPQGSHRDHQEAARNERQENGAELGQEIAPRIVTDISSSNRTDSGVSNATTSGSGSGGNTGSGSNQGSSGSGNDAKGSGEEQGREDNTSEGPDEKKMGIGLAPVPPEVSKVGPAEMKSDQTEATRAQKLQDKKRKRIEMRREYEAQQHLDSSESSDGQGQQLFRPGKPLTFDQVLVFSKIPRIVIQAAPPFLVVHTNAAYSRLTGIDSHHVVGKPISALLFLQENTTGNTEERPNVSSSEANNPPTGGVVIDQGANHGEPAPKRRRTEIGLERLVASSGFGHLHVVHVNTNPQHMVGRDVKVITDGPSAAEARRDEESSGTSTSSYDVQSCVIACRTSIAPIVSSPISVVTDREAELQQTIKRAKYHHDSQRKSTSVDSSSAGHAKYSPLQLVTHYVIQLQPHGESTAKVGSMESLSSNSSSVEARLLGLTKQEVEIQRAAVAPPLEGADAGGEPSSLAGEESTSEATIPVAAVG